MNKLQNPFFFHSFSTECCRCPNASTRSHCEEDKAPPWWTRGTNAIASLLKTQLMAAKNRDLIMLSLLFWQEMKMKKAVVNTPKGVDAKRYQTNEISIFSVAHQRQERKSRLWMFVQHYFTARTWLLWLRNLYDFEGFNSGMAANMVSQSIASLPSSVPTYLTAGAPPSVYPPRMICSVCGYWGLYKCRRCAMPYCDRNCEGVHAETRCERRVM